MSKISLCFSFAQLLSLVNAFLCHFGAYFIFLWWKWGGFFFSLSLLSFLFLSRTLSLFMPVSSHFLPPTPRSLFLSPSSSFCCLPHVCPPSLSFSYSFFLSIPLLSLSMPLSLLLLSLFEPIFSNFLPPTPLSLCSNITTVTVRNITLKAVVVLTYLTSWKRMRRSCIQRCS